MDFVLTFEELNGMFAAKEIDFDYIEPDECDEDFQEGSSVGRGFAVVGGVAAAVKDHIAHVAPDREVPMEFADGLRECRKMLLMARKGLRNGYLLEGMACPGGCVAGAGTITPVAQSAKNIEKYKASAEKHSARESSFAHRLHEAEE